VTIEIGRPRNRGRSHRDLLVVALAVALLVAGLVFAGRDSKRESADAGTSTSTTSTTPRSTSTTTTTTIATTTTTTTLPPLQLGERTGVRLLLSGDRGVSLLDLDTGELRDVPLPGSSQLIARDGGVVVQGPSGVDFYLSPFTGEYVELSDARDVSVLPAIEQDRVWIASYGPARQTVREVDTAGNVTVGPFDLPAGGGIVGLVNDGIVGFTHGSIYVFDRDGRTRRLGYGDVVAAGGDHVVATTCDEGLHCGLTVFDVVSGATRSLGDVASEDGYPQGIVSPDGTTAALYTVVNGSTRLRVLDLSSGDSTTLPPTVSNNGPAALAYSADSRWIFFVSGGDLYAHPVGSKVTRSIKTGPASADFIAVV